MNLSGIQCFLFNGDYDAMSGGGEGTYFWDLGWLRGKVQKCIPGSHRQVILYNVDYDSSCFR
jgi:hypothetical protein